MELRHLRTFDAVARTLSFTRAARELHFAQSSVSEQIQALEKELNGELFDRSRRQLRLTPQGQALAEYADRIIKLAEEARRAVVHASTRPGGELSVGALETLCSYRLPSVLSRYRVNCPEVRVTVGQGNRGELYEAVRRGEMDLCLTFGAPPNDPALRSEIVAVEPLVVIVPSGHRLDGRGVVPVEELFEEPFLATAPGCGFREMYDNAFGSMTGPLSTPVAEVGSIGALGACVASGMGCALLPLLAVRSLIDRNEVGIVPIKDTDFRTSITMTWLDKAGRRPNLTEFQAMLRSELAAERTPAPRANGAKHQPASPVEAPADSNGASLARATFPVAVVGKAGTITSSSGNL
jgi:DNA-binding transcriptional LysR family regulator